MSGVTAREATIDDSAAITEIYNTGIVERTATFETRQRDIGEVKQWFDGRHPVVVGELNGRTVSFAAASEYSSRECYSGIAEFSVYVCQEHRGIGAGNITMRRLVEESRKKGFWKLLSRVFTDNIASRNMLRSVGFREVGVYERHGKLENSWKDVVIVEFLIMENIR
ncbi:GCN5 family acetyltransferase [uncultured archaeon]|nr:GCN5 family acetyltransferase [uncultured archaeon]